MPRCERLHVVEGVLGIVLGVVWRLSQSRSGVALWPRPQYG
jgi:hypothetical protein